MNPNNNRKNKNHKSRSVKINKTVTLLVLFCLCIGAISMVAAKYIKQNTTKNNSVAAKEFYFESDLLDGKTHVIMPTADGGTANVTIRLKNYIDDLRYSETEIDYTVKVTEENATDSATDVSIDQATGTIATRATNNNNVTISNLKAGKIYKITATTDNIYKKTLTGIIKVSEPDKKIYASIDDEKQYIEVTIWTKDYKGEVILNYNDADLIPDNTDTKMKDATTGPDTITEAAWKANTSHVYRFFKNNENNDNENKTYQATVNGKEVTVSEKNE